MRQLEGKWRAETQAAVDISLVFLQTLCIFLKRQTNSLHIPVNDTADVTQHIKILTDSSFTRALNISVLLFPKVLFLLLQFLGRFCKEDDYQATQVETSSF